MLKPVKVPEKQSLLAIHGYRGDDLVRVIEVDAVHDNRVVGKDIVRNVFRAYLWSEIQEIKEVKR